jgi:hypothetical protein
MSMSLRAALDASRIHVATHLEPACDGIQARFIAVTQETPSAADPEANGYWLLVSWLDGGYHNYEPTSDWDDLLGELEGRIAGDATATGWTPAQSKPYATLTNGRRVWMC